MSFFPKADDPRNEYGMPVSANAPDNRGAFHQSVDQSVNKSLPWMVVIAVVSCSLSGLALGLSITARDNALRAERIATHQQQDLDRKLDRESRLQRVETDELRAALARAGIKLHEDTDKP